MIYALVTENMDQTEREEFDAYLDASGPADEVRARRIAQIQRNPLVEVEVVDA